MYTKVEFRVIYAAQEWEVKQICSAITLGSNSQFARIRDQYLLLHQTSARNPLLGSWVMTPAWHECQGSPNLNKKEDMSCLKKGLPCQGCTNLLTQGHAWIADHLRWVRTPIDVPTSLKQAAGWPPSSATVCRKLSWRKSSRGVASCTQSLTSRKAPECSRSLASPAWFPHCSLNLSEEFSQVNRCSANLIHNNACGYFFQLSIYLSPSKLEIASWNFGWNLRKIIHILSILHHSGRPYSNLNSPIVTS